MWKNRRSQIISFCILGESVKHSTLPVWVWNVLFSWPGPRMLLGYCRAVAGVDWVPRIRIGIFTIHFKTQPWQLHVRPLDENVTLSMLSNYLDLIARIRHKCHSILSNYLRMSVLIPRLHFAARLLLRHEIWCLRPNIELQRGCPLFSMNFQSRMWVSTICHPRISS